MLNDDLSKQYQEKIISSTISFNEKIKNSESFNQRMSQNLMKFEEWILGFTSEKILKRNLNNWKWSEILSILKLLKKSQHKANSFFVYPQKPSLQTRRRNLNSPRYLKLYFTITNTSLILQSLSLGIHGSLESQTSLQNGRDHLTSYYEQTDTPSQPLSKHEHHTSPSDSKN